MSNESCSFAMTRRLSTYNLARNLLTWGIFLCIHSLYASTGAQLVENKTPTEIGLSKSLAFSAGVYRDSSSNPLLKKTVVITGCNHGYLPFLNNFKCFIDRLNMKVLVFSMDLRTHMHVQHKMNSSLTSFHWVGKNAISEESADFRSEQFNFITHSKTSYTQMVLSLGYDVLFIDLDIALVRDPLPYIIWRNVDYVFTHNKICPQFKEWNFFTSDEEGNTGFYHVRSNPKTIKLWADVGSRSQLPKLKKFDDQTVFWIHLRNSSDPVIHPLVRCDHYNSTEQSASHLIACPLDGCMFSAGGLRGVAYTWIVDNLRKDGTKAISFHANYRSGMHLKVKDLRDHGLWIYQDGKCQDFKPLI